MKQLCRLFLTLSAFLTLCLAAAHAQQATSLPEGVVALCSRLYPGYEVAAAHGWGDDIRGQFAMVLHKDADNVLVIAERETADAGYRFTVENTHAVFDGEDAEIPSLLIDTGGDALFYSYKAGSVTTCHAAKQNGVWGQVGVFIKDEWNAEQQSYVYVQARELRYTWYRTDENDNVLEQGSYAPVPVSEEYIAQNELSRFDITLRSSSPWSGLYADECTGLADALLPEGVSPITIDVQENSLVIIGDAADGTRRLYLCDWDGAAYTIAQSKPLLPDTWIDAFHAGDGDVYVEREPFSAYFRRGPDGVWHYRGTVYGEFSVVGGGVKTYPYGEERFYVGRLLWDDIRDADFAVMPTTIEDALPYLDRTGFAVVNNPDPADRLHLRTAPKQSARSLGKFYNGTWLEVLETNGDWSHVKIGGLEGWMMSRYLTTGETMDTVKRAFPTLFTRGDNEEYPLYASPDEGSAVPAEKKIDGSHIDCIIGVHGDEWYIVYTSEGTVRYMKQEWFWAGNG